MEANPPTINTEVILNARTLRIRHQTYALNNLARVQVVELPKPEGAGKGNLKLAVIVWLLVGLFVSLPISSAARNSGVTLLMWAPPILAAIFTYRATTHNYPQLYALILETTGNPITALASEDYQELARLASLIIDAIEHPPTSEIRTMVNNIIMGDKIDQYGQGNVGKMGR